MPVLRCMWRCGSTTSFLDRKAEHTELITVPQRPERPLGVWESPACGTSAHKMTASTALLYSFML